jgi:hypothetical protein
VTYRLITIAAVHSLFYVWFTIAVQQMKETGKKKEREMGLLLS